MASRLIDHFWSEGMCYIIAWICANIPPLLRLKRHQQSPSSPAISVHSLARANAAAASSQMRHCLACFLKAHFVAFYDWRTIECSSSLHISKSLPHTYIAENPLKARIFVSFDS